MDTFPKCSVCLQPFTLKGPIPYLLPCLHAVCETCVTSAAGGVISCTTCQTQVNLTETSLQKDEVRQQEIFHLTIKHRPTELLCTHENDGNQAVCWCQECEEVLCEYCQNMHSSFKLSRNHTVHNLGDIAPPNLMSETNCRIHNRYPLDLFDKSCNKSICGRCLKGEHAGHEVEDLDEAASRGKQRIEQHAKDLSSLLSHQQTHLQSIRKDIENSDRTQNTLKGIIGQTFQSLRSQLDQREKELLIDLEAHTKETKETLQALQSACEDEHVRCTDVSEYIRKSLLYASNSAFLKLERSVDVVAQNYLETASPQPYDDATAVFTTNGLSKLKSDICGFGTASALKEERGDNTDDKETQTDDIFATLKQEHEMTLAEKDQSFQAAPETIDRLQTSLKSYQNGGCVHLMRASVADRCMFLYCTPVKYDKDTVNTDNVHINTEGDLVNRKSDTRPAGEGRLKEYWGTCSTDPLSRDGCPQYWEVEDRISLDKPLSRNLLILEVGVCREEQRDVSHCIGRRPHSYCMNVSHCTTHGGICRRIRKEGKYVLCLPDTLPNTTGTSHTLHYGVVYDDVRKKIVFIDVKEKKVMSTLDNVDSCEPLWPMFGVHNPHLLTVSMRLVVGSDINMTEEKKAMIVKALS